MIFYRFVQVQINYLVQLFLCVNIFMAIHIQRLKIVLNFKSFFMSIILTASPHFSRFSCYAGTASNEQLVFRIFYFFHGKSCRSTHFFVLIFSFYIILFYHYFYLFIYLFIILLFFCKIPFNYLLFFFIIIFFKNKQDLRFPILYACISTRQRAQGHRTYEVGTLLWDNKF